MSVPPFRSNTDVAIHVSDLDAAYAFYAGVLGFPLVERSATHLAVDTGAFRLWINRATDGAMSFVPSLDVTSAAAARADLVRAGCEIIRDAGDGTGFYARDPFGFVFDVIERPGAVDA
jgi:catechol 2,3-dioxygenase-like lactoylglutathione lyase family enzyme